jgi:alkanesulfonate monooxygenase SsuD/methylene tetrahydromethanopterin reductase-like flavin-dependent oxidoreductase (luciferase family)
LLGSPREHVEKLQALRELGVDQFAGYLQHDNKEETLRSYGERVIPAMHEPVVATA